MSDSELPPFLLVDTETTGLDAKKNDLIEIGAIIFDPNPGIVIETMSYVLPAETNPVEKINHIPASATQRWGRANPFEALDHFASTPEAMGTKRPVALAHNAVFDKKWLPTLAEHEWICTRKDAVWPLMHGGGGKLTEIALAYGIGISRAHRALDDCLLIASLLERVHQMEGGLHDWYDRATADRIETKAMVSFDDKHLAKEAGFIFDYETKEWRKRMTVKEAKALAKTVDFKIHRVKQ